MAIAENVYDAHTALARSNNWAKFQAEQPGAWRIIEKVIELRKEAAKYAE